MSTFHGNLRRALRAKRNKLAATLIEQYTNKILSCFFTQPEWKTAQHIGAYFSFDNEVPTQHLIAKSWQTSKQVYLPVVQDNKNLRFAIYKPITQLKRNCYGINEPNNSYFFPVEELDIVILPLLAFDKQCQRLGSGMGYYDRTFAFLNTAVKPKKPVLIGLAYEFQCIDNLRAEVWDVGLDKVITETLAYNRQV